ncbi:MAG: hypothetical protein WCX65_08760 [bacterium]
MRQKYFELTGQQRAMLLAALLFMTASVIYGLALSPAVKAVQKAGSDKKVAIEAGKSMDVQIAKLRTLGMKNNEIGVAQTETLRANGNEVLYSSNVSSFMDGLRELNERLGGKNFRLEEGAIQSAYVTLGERNDVYKLMRLPAKISFEGDYSVMSNFLFQLYALKRMIKIGDVDIQTKGYTGDIRVTLDLGIYYVEES